jgi:hypothetical protein
MSSEENSQDTRKLHELKNRITEVFILAMLFFSLLKPTGTTEFHFYLDNFIYHFTNQSAQEFREKGRLE